MNKTQQNCAEKHIRFPGGAPEAEAGACAEPVREALTEQDEELWTLVKDLPEEVFESEPSGKLDEAVKAAAREAARQHMHRTFPPFLLWAAGAAAAFALSFIVLLHNHEQPVSAGGKTAAGPQLEAAASDWDMNDLYLELSDISGSFLETESKMSMTNLTHVSEAELVLSVWQNDELY